MTMVRRARSGVAVGLHVGGEAMGDQTVYLCTLDVGILLHAKCMFIECMNPCIRFSFFECAADVQMATGPITTTTARLGTTTTEDILRHGAAEATTTGAGAGGAVGQTPLLGEWLRTKKSIVSGAGVLRCGLKEAS
jgi:hypothetical protein